MNIIVDDATRVVLMAGNDLSIAQIQAQYTVWVLNYRPINAFTVYENVALPLGYVDECWTYSLGGVWAIIPGKETIVNDYLGALTAPTNIVGTPFRYETLAGLIARMDLKLEWVGANPGNVMYEIRHKLSSAGTWNPSQETYTTTAVIIDLAAGTYDVEIRAKITNDISSIWASAQIIVPEIAATVPNVTGLMRDGDPLATTFTGRNVKINWNFVAPPGVNPIAGLVGRANSWFRYYIIRVYNGAGTELRTDSSTTEYYEYTYDMNKADSLAKLLPTAQRTLRFDVTVMSAWGEESPLPASITLTNPQVAKITGLAPTGAVTMFSVGVPVPADTDFQGFLAYASKTQNFVPSAANQVNKGGPESVISKFDIAEGTWYFKVAGYDIFGTDGLVYSDEIAITVLALSVAPEVLDSAQRVDFIVRDVIFYFNGSTLVWDDGYIDRSNKSYTLAAGSLAAANYKFLIATFTDGAPNTVSISYAAISGGLPAVTSNQAIIGYTGNVLTPQGNYIAYIRQSNSAIFEGADIRYATITDAHITGTISANKIQTLNGGVTIAGSAVTLTDLGTTANWGTVSGRPSNIAVLTGAEDIQNALLDPAIADAATKANWTGVTGRPNTTYIDANGVYTGTVGTNQLIAGAALIGNALIGDLDAGKINAGLLNVDRINAGAITTSKLMANAVTVNAAAYRYSQGLQYVTAAQGTFQQLGASLTINMPEASPVLLSVVVDTACYSANAQAMILFRVRRLHEINLIASDIALGTDKDTRGSSTILWQDTPGVGAFTYVIEFEFASPGANDGLSYVQGSAISALGVKR